MCVCVGGVQCLFQFTLEASAVQMAVIRPPLGRACAHRARCGDRDPGRALTEGEVPAEGRDSPLEHVTLRGTRPETAGRGFAHCLLCQVARVWLIFVEPAALCPLPPAPFHSFTVSVHPLKSTAGPQESLAWLPQVALGCREDDQERPTKARVPVLSVLHGHQQPMAPQVAERVAPWPDSLPQAPSCTPNTRTRLWLRT